MASGGPPSPIDDEEIELSSDEDAPMQLEAEEKPFFEELMKLLNNYKLPKWMFDKVETLFNSARFVSEKKFQRVQDDNLRLREEISKMETRPQRPEKSTQKLMDELIDVNARLEESNQDMTNENLILHHENMELKERLEETFQRVADESLRLEETIKRLMVENMRTKQLEKYSFLYYWLHSDCHVSLETPARTYISIHPPGTKGFNPNQQNVVTSLEEDIKRLGNPAEIIPLVGLNVHEIDEWYKIIDVHIEQWTEDYSLLETSLSKASEDFEKYIAKHKPSNPKKKSPLYIYAAAWDHSHWRTATAEDGTTIVEITHL